MRNLKSLGYRVPLVVVNKAHMANQIYPFAVSLIESVRMYEGTCDKVMCFVAVFDFRHEVKMLQKGSWNERITKIGLHYM